MDALSNRFMQEAIDLSLAMMRQGKGGPFGAVVVKDNQIVGRGWNAVTSTNDPTAHAEIVAIRDACRALKTFQLSGCELYASCEPCPMCLSAAYWARVGKVVYGATRQDAAVAGFDDDFLYREISKPNGERTLAAVELMREQAQAVLREWQAKPDKVPY